MRTRTRGYLAAGGAVVVLALAAIAAPVAQAASHIIHVGRGGTFVVTAPGPASAASILAGVAVSLAAIAVVGYVALWLGRDRGARLQAVPAPAERADAGGDTESAERRRRAA